MFVNTVAIREAVSLRHGIFLPQESVQKLQSACYLFRSALNSSQVVHIFCKVFLCPATSSVCESVRTDPRFGFRIYRSWRISLEITPENAQATDLNLCVLDVCMPWVGMHSCQLLRLEHLCLDQAPRLSPMHTSCYGDEDMASCHHY